MLQLKIDEERCIQCGECVNDCPARVLQLPENGLPQVVEGKADNCIGCQHCLAICPTAALSILGIDPDKSIDISTGLPTPQSLETLIMARRSVRRYTDTPVEKETIARMMDVLSYSPTGKNNTELTLTVVDDAAVMERLRQQTMYGLRSRVETETLPKGLEFMSAFVGAWSKGQDIIFRGAPHMLVATTPATGPSPAADCHIALSYFELLAASMGLGTVWCGMAKWAFEAVPEMYSALAIPQNHLVGYVMLFGHPAMRYHRTVQRPPGKVHIVN